MLPVTPRIQHLQSREHTFEDKQIKACRGIIPKQCRVSSVFFVVPWAPQGAIIRDLTAPGAPDLQRKEPTDAWLSGVSYELRSIFLGDQKDMDLVQGGQ